MARTDQRAGGGTTVAVKREVAKKADVARLFDQATTAFDKIDILVNNAGIFEVRPLDQITEEDFHRHLIPMYSARCWRQRGRQNILARTAAA